VKPALDLLREIQRQPSDSSSRESGSTAFSVCDAEILKIREMPIGAVRIRTPKFGSIWLALDETTADELRAEEQQREHPRPVLMEEDVTHLENKSEEMIRAALEVIRAFPGARILH
jgi:hypothetical protein